MRVPEGFEQALAAKFGFILPHLNERQRRLLLGIDAWVLGHGGIRLVARAAGVGEAMVSRGVAEVEAGDLPQGRIRQPGAGRKHLVDADPGMRAALLAVVEPDVRSERRCRSRGISGGKNSMGADPMRVTRWGDSQGFGMWPPSYWPPTRRSWILRSHLRFDGISGT
jgi:hypothetical protein